MQHLKQQVFIILILLSALTAVVFQSCVRNTIDITSPNLNWNPNIAAPLINSSLTIANIISNTNNSANVVVDKTNFCTLVYKSTLFSYMAKDLIQLPVQTVSQSYSLSAAQIAQLQLNPGQSFSVNYVQAVNFDTTGTGGILVDSIIYKSGILSDYIVSGFKYNIAITALIPSARKAGISFSSTVNINYTGAIPTVSTNNMDISGYHFDMTDSVHGSNKFNIYYALAFIPVAGSSISPTDQITFTQTCANPMFDKLFGYMGNKSLVPVGKNLDTCALSIFKNAVSGGGTFTLQDPRMTFIISNSFGLPVNANITKLIGYTAFPPQSLALTGYPTPLPIISPTITQIGQLKVDSFFLNNTNSNLAAVVNSSPQNIIYQLSAQANPAGLTHSNFVIDTSRISVDLSVQLPLYGTMKNFTVVDTIKTFNININSGSNSSSTTSGNTTITATIESLLLRTTVSNGFPDSAIVQIYVTDSLYHKPYLDSLLGTNGLIMNSGQVSTSGPNIGQVISPSVKVTDSYFNAARAAKLTNSKNTHALIKATISTYNNGNTPVKIYSTEQINVKVGVQSQVNVSSSHHHN
jgi:hypothetical protein